MSQYQCYEVPAVDHCLADKGNNELYFSLTCVDITPNRLCNQHTWKNLKDGEDRRIEEYSDEFLYYAKWEPYILKQRFPSTVLDFKTVQTYFNGDNFTT